MKRLMMGIIVVFAAVCMISGTTIAEEKEPIVLGSIWDLVGFGGALGQTCLQGSKLAVKEVNDAGGLRGHMIKYTNIDGQSDLAVISNAALRLTEKFKVLAGVGGEDDSLNSASGPVFQAHKTVYLTGCATTPTQPRMGEYIFMPVYGDHFQGVAAAKYCVQTLGWKKIAVLWDSASAYSTYLTKSFTEAFKFYTNDPTAVVVSESYLTGDVVFTAQLTRIRKVRDKIDGFVTVPPEPQDAPTYTKQARNLGIKVPMFFTDGADDISLIKVGGKHVEGAHISTQFAADFPTTEVGKKFVKAFTNEYGHEPGAFAAAGYDCMRLLLESIEAIMDEKGEKGWNSMSLAQKRTAIRDMLQNRPVFNTTTVPTSWPPAETAIYPRVPDKPVVFKQVKNQKLTYAAHMEPEEFTKDMPTILKNMGVK